MTLFVFCWIAARFRMSSNTPYNATLSKDDRSSSAAIRIPMPHLLAV
ncbi:MAG: hypothetical protein ABJC63_07400 [Gemmatimonadales bacterium]